MKKLIFILIILCSCNQGLLNSSTDSIQRELNKNFLFEGSGGDKLSMTETSNTVEAYFLSQGYLKSTSKRDYQEMYETYILSDIQVNLDRLYQRSPNAEYLLYPSVLANVFEVYGNTKGNNPSLRNLRAPLSKMKAGHEINFLNPKVFDGYLKAISDRKFENNIIYRIPLILFTLQELDQR